MPIVIDHTPGNLVGQLAQNAGQFATNQTTFEDGLQAQGLHDREAAQQHQQDFEQARLDQASHVADTRSQQQFAQQQLRGEQSLSLQHQKAADHLDAIAAQMQAQGANQMDVQQVRDHAAMERQAGRIAAQTEQFQTHNNTQLYGIDQRTQLGYDTNAANNATSTANNLNTNNTREQLAGMRQSPDVEGQRWGRSVRAHQESYNSILKEASILQHAISHDPYNSSGQVPQMMQKLQDLQQEMAGHKQDLDALLTNPPGPPATAAADPSFQPMAPGLPGPVPPAPEASTYTPAAATVGTPDPQDSQDGTTDPAADIESEMRAHIAVLKAQGAPHEAIRQHLTDTFGDALGGY